HLVFYRLLKNEKIETSEILRIHDVPLIDGIEAERISEGPRICDVTCPINLDTAIRLYEKLAETDYLRDNARENDFGLPGISLQSKLIN
ncbi:MAG: hypothetical protein AABW93_00875, partial [Nanoarchaeota archaeon]